MKLEKLFRPGSVAVVGASRTAGKVGNIILQNLTKFEGDVYPVNPGADDIMGMPCYKSVQDIDDVDMAVVSLPQHIANQAVRDCRDAGVDIVIIVTSGYGEVGNTEAEQELLDIVAGTGTRILGPNCLGVFNAHTGLDTLFIPEEKSARPRPGNVSIVTQSGGVGFMVMNELGHVSKYVSYGNQIDISELEIMEALRDDEDTAVIASYIEALKDGRRFLDAMRDITTRKPVVMLKAGRSTRGKQAASSHTGSMAGSEAVYSGVLRQAHVVQTSTLAETIDAATALSRCHPLPGGDIAVVTNCGGMAVMETDMLSSHDNPFDRLLPAAWQHRLQLADFSPELQRHLDELLPAHTSKRNPVDLGGDADADDYRRVLDLLADQADIDGVIAIGTLHPASIDGGKLALAFQRFAERYSKPFLVSLGVEIEGKTERGSSEYYKPVSRISLLEDALKELGIPVYGTPERLANGIRALHAHGRWQRIDEKDF
ncbi:MAG: CoA-binding protein [Candidatus Thermoplasmatota archaeon]|nr:CoA-binding protein [Candidatus Thermoplasmatota archaeon]